MIEGWIILALLVVIVQIALSLFQIRYYDTFMKKLVKQYHGNEGYTLESEQVKHLFRTIIAVAIIDKKLTIIDCYTYQGATIFSKFKKVPILIGKTINSSIEKDVDSLGKLEKEVINKLIEKIKSKIEV